MMVKATLYYLWVIELNSYFESYYRRVDLLVFVISLNDIFVFTSKAKVNGHNLWYYNGDTISMYAY